jgi:hypothetical protein
MSGSKGMRLPHRCNVGYIQWHPRARIQEMKPLKIDCANENWKPLLKRNLQDGIEATLDKFDYTADGQLCELLAVSHSMNFRLDVRNKVGHFTKRSSGN